MERIAAIVEGHVEAQFMTQSYPNALVQRCIPNGSDVKIALIIESIKDQLEILDKSVRRVLILLDREKRTVTSALLTTTLRNELGQSHPHLAFYIGVADRQIENWILADGDFIKKEFKLRRYTYCGDGVGGKGKLTEVAKDNLAPGDKARLLKSISPTRAASVSPSLMDFISQINFSWWWVTS